MQLTCPNPKCGVTGDNFVVYYDSARTKWAFCNRCLHEWMPDNTVTKFSSFSLKEGAVEAPKGESNGGIENEQINEVER